MNQIPTTIPRVPLTELDRNELKRRIHAARLLRGMSQEGLDQLFSVDGLGKSAGRLERGDPRVTLNRSLLTGLVHHLRVPEEWFTVRDVDSLVYPDGAPESIPGKLTVIEEQIRRARAENEARAAEVHQQISEALKPILARLQRRG